MQEVIDRYHCDVIGCDATVNASDAYKVGSAAESWKAVNVRTFGVDARSVQMREFHVCPRHFPKDLFPHFNMRGFGT